MGKKSEFTALNALASNQNSGLLDNALEKSITYIAASTGAVGSTTLCNVTGTVALSIFGICEITNTITAGATIEVGTAISTAGLIALTAGDAIAVNEIWHDATPDSSIELTSVISHKIVTSDIIQKITTNTITAGVMTYYIRWAPISQDGNVVIA